MRSMVEGARLRNALSPFPRRRAIGRRLRRPSLDGLWRGPPPPRFARSPSPALRGRISSLLHLHLDRLRRVVAEDVDDLHDDRIVAGIRVGWRDLSLRVRYLPFVVEGVAFIVPIDRPVVDPLRPVLDRPARL